MDFGNLFGDLQNQVDKAWQDVQKTGVPALEATLEQWGIDNLSVMKQQTQKTVDANVKEILNRPPATGLGKYLNDILKQPLEQNYGGLFIAGAVAIGIVAVFAFGGNK